jgi:spermidine synthase
VRIKHTRGDLNPYLELLLYCNRLQLATADALYSDGDRYVPAATVVEALKSSLAGVHSVLVLGTGLGSMVSVLKKGGFRPAFTLVEKDKVVLQLAMDLLSSDADRLTPVCEDASTYMEHNTAKYDLIFIDVFVGRVVPDFVSTPAFLQQCRAALNVGGHVAFNYMVNEEGQWANVRNTFSAIFPQNSISSKRVNRILIGAVS